ncbi:MAG: hypothetical protein KIT10_11450 [Flavobacteriales bacterium]|nr:hypothetical protein [Flavobacteriales bacterium]
MQYLGYLLALIHAALLLWASGGFMEMLLPNVPWKRFSNPDFPTYILIPHWSVVLYASAGFLYGYFTHWSKTPPFMLIGYSFMMLLCVIETFGYMTNKTKYIAMGSEFVTYVVILLLLFKSRYFIEYFNR